MNFSRVVQLNWTLHNCHVWISVAICRIIRPDQKNALHKFDSRLRHHVGAERKVTFEPALQIEVRDFFYLRVIQVQSGPIPYLVLFKCRIDEPVLCFSRWIKQHEGIRPAPARVVFLMEGHSPGSVKNGAELIHQVLYRVCVLNTQCNVFPWHPVLFAFGASVYNDKLWKSI